MSDNFTRAVRFEGPDYIPMTFHINSACWEHYPKDALFDLMEAHPHLFPDFSHPGEDWKPAYGPNAIAARPYTDPMGCVWHTTDDGIVGAVLGHPLEDRRAFGTTWHIPDPDRTDGLVPVDWAEQEAQWKAIKAAGGSFRGGLRHGHTFLQLCDLRGYEALLEDMWDGEPLLDELIDRLTEFDLALVKRFVKNGCDPMAYPEDLGMQIGPMLSPAMFRRYIKPAYKRLMQPARDAGIPVHMHSDGDIRDLADDLIDSGVEVIDLQDLVNGIDWIADRFKGKICVELDIDRQRIPPTVPPLISTT